MSCKPLSEEMKQWVHDNWPEESAATPAHVLRTQVMDPRIPKNEREWWASNRIKELEALWEAEAASVHRLSARELELGAENQRLREAAMAFDTASSFGSWENLVEKRDALRALLGVSE